MILTNVCTIIQARQGLCNHPQYYLMSNGDVILTLSSNTLSVVNALATSFRMGYWRVSLSTLKAHPYFLKKGQQYEPCFTGISDSHEGCTLKEQLNLSVDPF